jgi:hypothetical protein
MPAHRSRRPHEHVQVIGHHFLGHDLPAVLGGDLLRQLAAAGRYTATQDSPPILRAPHQVQAQ